MLHFSHTPDGRCGALSVQGNEEHSHDPLTLFYLMSVTFVVTLPTGGPPGALTASLRNTHGAESAQPAASHPACCHDIEVGMRGWHNVGRRRAVGQRTLAGP